MNVSVYTIIGEKLTMRGTKEEVLKFLAEHGVKEDHILKVEVAE